MLLEAEARRHDITGREKAHPHNITVSDGKLPQQGEPTYIHEEAWLTKLHTQQHVSVSLLWFHHSVSSSSATAMAGICIKSILSPYYLWVITCNDSCCY